MKTILILTDFTEKSQHAAEFAYLLASRVNANLILYNSYYVPQGTVFAGIYTSYTNDFSGYDNESLKQLKLQAAQIKEKCEHQIYGKTPTIHLQNDLGNVAQNIKELVEKQDVWLIIMGNKRNEGLLDKLIYGNDTKMVIENASCPVMLISEKTTFDDLNKIVFTSAGFDKEDFKALNFLTELAKPFDSEIVITHILPKTDKEEIQNYKVPKEVYLAWSEFKYQKVTFKDIRSDDVAKSVERFTEIENMDLITLIYRKHKFFDQLFHESNFKHLLNYDKVPLLVFPSGT
jgi:nucleotide-binding universal stress UspA family protein